MKKQVEEADWKLRKRRELSLTWTVICNVLDGQISPGRQARHGFEAPERAPEGQPASFQESLHSNTIRDENSDDLGDRKVDRAANWTSRTGTYMGCPGIHGRHQGRLIIRQISTLFYNRPHKSLDSTLFQRQILDLIANHYTEIILRRKLLPNLLRINVECPAGNGRSFWGYQQDNLLSRHGQ